MSVITFLLSFFAATFLLYPFNTFRGLPFLVIAFSIFFLTFLLVSICPPPLLPLSALFQVFLRLHYLFSSTLSSLLRFLISSTHLLTFYPFVFSRCSLSFSFSFFTSLHLFLINLTPPLSPSLILFSSPSPPVFRAACSISVSDPWTQSAPPMLVFSSDPDKSLPHDRFISAVDKPRRLNLGNHRPSTVATTPGN